MSHTSAESSKTSTSKSAATSRKASGKSAGPGTGSGNVGREEMIAVAAYYRAEHRGFDGSDPVADWLAAEAEIDAALNHSKEAVVH
jgi:hypothetical protein